LLTFYSLWPEYKTNDLYIAGESYAGVYVPWLAHNIQKYNEGKAPADQINLKGFMVGNGVTSVEFDDSNATFADYMWWHALYGQQTRNNYTEYCVNNFSESECDGVMNKINEEAINVNPYDVYRYCWHEDIGADNNDFTGWTSRFKTMSKTRSR